MPETEEGQSDTSRSNDARPDSRRADVQGRYPTSAERKELIEDAKAFKRKHEKAFRILSESEGDE